MKDHALVYKLTAIVAVCWAMYSCAGPAESQSTTALAQQIAQLRTEIGLLRDDVKGCTTEAFLGIDTDNPCSPDVLPDDAVVTATFCTDQGLGLELSAALDLEMGLEMEAGAGWTSAPWGKATGKVAAPMILPVFPFLLPTKVGSEAAGHIGRSLQICVDLPISPKGDQVALIADLVKGVNIDGGPQAKFQRRTNLLLNRAAFATPNASGKLIATAQSRRGTGIAHAIASDDAFDLADDAFDRFMTSGFQANARAGGVLSDPIFADLAASMDLPQQVTSIIDNPQQFLSGIQSTTLANTCTNLGIDATIRGQYPQINTLCSSIASLPSDGLKSVTQTLGTLQSAVTTIQTRVQTLNNLVCSIPGVNGC